QRAGEHATPHVGSRIRRGAGPYLPVPSRARLPAPETVEQRQSLLEAVETVPVPVPAAVVGPPPAVIIPPAAVVPPPAVVAAGTAAAGPVVIAAAAPARAA